MARPNQPGGQGDLQRRDGVSRSRQWLGCRSGTWTSASGSGFLSASGLTPPDCRPCGFAPFAAILQRSA
jgi:hypothetical protein